MFRGRWGSVNVARIYITDALGVLTELQLGEVAQARLKLWVKVAHDFALS